MNINQLSYNKLLSIQYLLNQRPRKSLLFESPFALFITLPVESTKHSYNTLIFNKIHKQFLVKFILNIIFLGA